ncbi:MAG: hypothetical protein IPQ07_29415 [Myxococcales bacterium]|nr:hypothetical protein [Myxococcales bacterium]
MVVAVGVARASLASAAPTVQTDLSEVRACHPLDGGDFLVGTGGGLVRFNARGAVRAVWTAVDGLPGTRIDGISAVGDALWIGTEAGAAVVTLDGTKLAVTRTAETKSVREVVAFDGALYAATWEGGVRKLGARGSTELRWKGGNNPAARARVSSLAVADGALWAGTANGLYRLANGTFELTSIEAGANEVAALYGDGATLWIGTTAGLYTREGAQVRGYGGGDVRHLAKVDGAIVAATFGGGLVRIDRGRLIDVARAPKGLAMAQSITERGGAACAGGLEGLWLRAKADAPWVAAAPAAGPPTNDVSALAAAGDKLWVGTFDHGLASYEQGVWKKFEHAKLDRRINALLVDGAKLWVATAAGLTVIDGTNVRQLTKADGLPARGILSLAKLRDGRILVGTSAGAAIVGEGRPLHIGAKQNLEAKNVWAVAEDADGWIWLGTTTGLFRGKADDTAWTRYSVATGHLRDDWVMAIATRDRSIWVGTYKGGVTRFDPTDAGVTTTPLGDGWINPGGLRFLGDALFATTMEGVRIGDGTSATWQTLDRMPGKDTTAAARIGDTLFISTRRGLVSRPGYWTR